MALIEKQSVFLPVIQIMNRELKAFFQSFLAWFILFFMTLINGLASYWYIKDKPVSNQAMQLIFYFLFGTVLISGVLLAMRLFSEEKANGTIELLITAPVTETQIVAGKYLSALVFLFFLILATFPVPLTVIIYGSAFWGHIFTGYLGVFLVGACGIAITTFYSTLTKTQLLAAVSGGANIAVFLLLGFFSPFLSNPFQQIFREFSFYVHFIDFEQGVIMLKHVIFYSSVICFYLALSVISLGSHKWR